MRNRISNFFALLFLALMASTPTLANDPLKELIGQQVSSLEDGTRMTQLGVERAILDACTRRKLQASVVEPGVILAHWERGAHAIAMRISYSDSSYSIRYEDSRRMGFDPARHSIKPAYNRLVDLLAENIESNLEVALDRLEVAMNRMKDARPRKPTRITPRNAA